MVPEELREWDSETLRHTAHHVAQWHTSTCQLMEAWGTSGWAFPSSSELDLEEAIRYPAGSANPEWAHVRLFTIRCGSSLHASHAANPGLARA